MEFIDKHKALIITILISSTLVLAMFAVGIKKHSKIMAESYYELPPPLTPEEERIIEELAKNEADVVETNKAYNSESEFKELMKNFKTFSAEDFEQDAKRIDTEDTELSEAEDTALSDDAETSEDDSSQDYALNESELSSFNRINNVIAKRTIKNIKSTRSDGDNQTNKLSKNTGVNTNSSVSYSLVNRKDRHLPPPVYLCEEGGKIVINITVNETGKVIETYVNTSSNSKNACLIESALQYANEARFNPDPSRPKQIGSITYYFKGKR